jgi:FAD/FMN-containing dehydrogenase
MRGPLSWNRWPRVDHRAVITLQHRHDPLPEVSGFMLAHGAGRSYGDVCLNEQGTLLLTRRLNRFIEFDRAAGRLRCESGVLVYDALQLIVPQGWFLPVTPGTGYVTIGGAIANDVHGKNQLRPPRAQAGTVALRWRRDRLQPGRKLRLVRCDDRRSRADGLDPVGGTRPVAHFQSVHADPETTHAQPG